MFYPRNPLAMLLFVAIFVLSSVGVSRATTTETILHTFGTSPNRSDGAYPMAGLVADGSGNLYGTAEFGGSLGHGTVFMLLKASGYSYAVLHSFGTSPNASDGANPVSGLLLDTSGNLYGTTQYGGTGSGVVFKLSSGKTGWTEVVLHNFGGAGDGANPVAGLVADTSGNLYGTTKNGGAGYGVAFMLLPGANGWIEGILHTFGTVGGGSDGKTPVAGLSIGPNVVYGTTVYGGTGYGVMFQLSPGKADWTETVLHAFTGGADGANPEAGVTVGNGLYTTTFNGGSSNLGVIFELGSSSPFYTFVGGNSGADPAASVFITSPDFGLYGTTEGGGIGYGEVFTFVDSGGGCTTPQAHTTLHTFGTSPNASDGANPTTGLIADSAGNLYGTTQGGGLGYGVVYELHGAGAVGAHSIRSKGTRPRSIRSNKCL
jgi:uncharacterized repeat protein (TIGR03803 family)